MDGAISTFCGGGEGKFLGGSVRADEAGLEGVFGGGITAGARPVCGDGELRASEGETAQLSQRLLCSRFRDAAGDAAPAGGALARPELSTAGPGAVSTPGGGSDAADPGSVSARHLDAASGAGGGDPQRRRGERADGLEAEPPSGRLGEGLPAGAFEGRVGIPVLGWGEPAGATTGGRKRVQMLVAYGVRADGTRPLLAFQRSQGESQAAWEGFLNGLYARGLSGKNLLLIVTDGCPGLAAALQTVYPQVKHQRCWMHKMRNILEHVRQRDDEAVKADAQAIYRAESRREAERAFGRFRARWQAVYPTMVKRLEKDLPELLTFFDFPRSLWRKLRTTNVIERCFVEERRRTRPMVCFVNVESVDRIIYAIFNGYNEQHQWRNRTLRLFTQAA
jgi:transposase-like protein